MDDLNLVLELWGRDIQGVDIDDDGDIGILDLLLLLEAWGPCE